MDYMQRYAAHRPAARLVSGERVRPADTPFRVAGQLPAVVYFIRTRDGCIKIGYTKDLSNRRAGLGVPWDAVLVVIRGGRAEERALHQRFRHLRLHGEEYFEPAPELIEYINELRTALGVSAVAPWQRIQLPPITRLDK